MSAATSRKSAAGSHRDEPRRSRAEDKLEHLLSAASGLMARQGYDQTTIRDVARETGFSLAGMYYYFKGKEDLLFQIQQRTFASLLEEQQAVVRSTDSDEEKLRRLIGNHISFFTRHSDELKICTFELESIKGERYSEIEDLRRSYFRLFAEVMRDLLGARASNHLQVRHHTLFVFGMLNWLVLWFDSRRDGPVDRLAGEMTDLVLNGIPAGRSAEKGAGRRGA